jgi:hypothetical protein
VRGWLWDRRPGLERVEGGGVRSTFERQRVGRVRLRRRGAAGAAAFALEAVALALLARPFRP